MRKKDSVVFDALRLNNPHRLCLFWFPDPHYLPTFLLSSLLVYLFPYLPSFSPFSVPLPSLFLTLSLHPILPLSLPPSGVFVHDQGHIVGTAVAPPSPLPPPPAAFAAACRHHRHFHNCTPFPNSLTGALYLACV